MKIIILDGDKIKNIDDFHTSFAKMLNFPAYYGRNLDALHDLLTEISDELYIFAVNTDELEENLGARWDIIVEMMEEIENENIHFITDKM